MKNVYLVVKKKSFLIVKSSYKKKTKNLLHPGIDILSVFMVAKATFLL